MSPPKNTSPSKAKLIAKPGSSAVESHSGVAREKCPWNARTKVKIGQMLDREIARLVASEKAIDQRTQVGAQSAGDNEVDASLADLEARELIDLQSAKLRFGRADFGRCALCEQWIEKQRLLALPSARTCVACAHLAASTLA